MNNNLDKSWSDNLLDGSLGKVYLLGASDFQNKAIEEFNQLDADDDNSSYFKHYFIEIIKNLKK